MSIRFLNVREYPTLNRLKSVLSGRRPLLVCELADGEGSFQFRRRREWSGAAQRAEAAAHAHQRGAVAGAVGRHLRMHREKLPETADDPRHKLPEINSYLSAPA